MQKIADEALEYARRFVSQGHPASYIPELSKVDPDKLGLYIVSNDGRIYIQSLVWILKKSAK